VLRKYDDARRRVQAAQDPDDREAFALLERQRRQAVLPYAEAADVVEGWPTLELPLWLTGSSPESAMSAIVVPVAPEDADADGSSWRIASTFLEGIELARRDLAGEGAATIVERGSVAGCLAVRVEGLDTELLPLLLDEALGRRPSLTRLGVKLRWEEAPHVRLPIEVREEEVTTLDTEGTAVTGPATGGSTREIAARLGMDLPEIVTVLVARGLPFPDDLLEAGTEESLRSLLGLEAFVEAELPSPSPAPEPPPAPPLAPELEVAGRIVAKLLRKHVIGGKHTAIQNVYGHHFSDADKDLAKTVTERLILVGILMEKQSVGARHVSMNPRMIPQARALADHGRVDADVLARLVGP
jgi:hypothetical protein